jgi:tetratricopeptide (TPR) repeat protein
VQMPDSVVVCFTLNFQSIDGASAAARSIVEQRTRQGKPVGIFPVPMRVEVSAEKIKYEQVSNYALQRFLGPFDEHEALAGTDPRTYWDHVAVPYIGFYVFEEQLAWFLDLNRTTGVLASTMRLAKYVAGVDALSLRGPDIEERREVLALYGAVWAERLREQRRIRYDRICFVIIPFGKKVVGDRTVDFDYIYETIFRPAIGAVALPEGGMLEPYRTDRDFFSGDIQLEMFQYLEYSRFVVADISALNFNVAYELGARHRARQSGTVIFRQAQSPVPFDISAIKVFPYEAEPAENAEHARGLITRVLTELLIVNRLDSPIRAALQRQSGNPDQKIQEAENAIRSQDWPSAIRIYHEVIAADPKNLLARMKLGLLCRDRGLWHEALEQFSATAELSPSYGEAYREKGGVENRIAHEERRPLDIKPAPGELSLRHAIELNDKDFDAHASLGGILKRAHRYDEALECYERAVAVSGGHPYPLLNALRLRVQAHGRLELTPTDQRALQRAERVREMQTQQKPPFDAPWSFFDLAEIKLYRGNISGFLQTASEGFKFSDADWQIMSFVSSLKMLAPAGEEIHGLEGALAEIEKMAGLKSFRAETFLR